MAGIGFELRKILKNRTILSIIKGFSSATFIASGPMLISIFLIVTIDMFLKLANITMIDRETIKASIMYAYVFSMINASGFIMLISRYVSDKLFIKNTKDILSSLIGAVAVTLIVGGIFAFVFFSLSPLPFLHEFLSFILFVELTVLYILMAYISAVKDFNKVAISYLLGSMITIILAVFMYYFQVNIVIGTLFSFVVGYFAIIIILLYTVKVYFEVISKDVFSFVYYFKDHYMLFLINLFYTIGIFIHNIIFWKFSSISTNIMDTFYYAPAYDTASFFAVLTTIPAAIIFVVKFETSFYEKYKRFCDIIVEGGSLRDLVTAKTRMIDTLKRELTFIMEIQLIITIVLTILGAYVILPIFANDNQAIELYVFLSIGFFMSYMTFIIIIILIYFDIQKEALIITVIFLISTIIFTFLSIYLGEKYYGLGYDLSSLITLIISTKYLSKEIELIDYRLYSK